VFRRGAVVLVMALVAAACGNSGDSESSIDIFCEEARAFQQFQQTIELVLFDPAETQQFFVGSMERISRLAEIAPPTVRGDVETVRLGFEALDKSMAEAGYNVLLVPESALDNSGTEAAAGRIDDFLGSACRGDGDPIAGFGDDPFAPSVLSLDEIEDLQSAVDEDGDDLEQLVAVQLEEEFGLTGNEASCIVSGLDISLITSLAGGDPITAEATDRFVAVLETCGVDMNRLGGR